MASRPSSTSANKLANLYRHQALQLGQQFFLLLEFVFQTLCHTKTPTFIFGLIRFTALYFSKRFRTVCSALSRMEQVFTKTKSASSRTCVVLYPFGQYGSLQFRCPKIHRTTIAFYK
jgi:hypothetical protein